MKQKLARRNWFNPFLNDFNFNFDKDMDFSFNNLNNKLRSAFDCAMPKINVKEEKNKYVIDIAMPGIDKDKLEIYTDNGYLTISYNDEVNVEEEDDDVPKKKAKDRDNDNYLYKEWSKKSFSHSYKLDDGINEEDIVAEYHDGIITVEVPKGNKERRQKTIKVK